MEIENISNPGQEPKHGDRVKYTHSDGSTETKEYYVPQEPASDPDVPSQPMGYIIYKADIYRRCTDEEAEALQAILDSSPVRLRGIFNSATVVNTLDDYYPALEAAIKNALGEDRASVILGPSEV